MLKPIFVEEKIEQIPKGTVERIMNSILWGNPEGFNPQNKLKTNKKEEF